MVVDGKESGNCFFDEMHEWSHEFDTDYRNGEDINVFGGNCLLHTIKSPFFSDSEWKRLCEKTKKGALQRMKEKNQKEQVVDWLTTTINNLEVFKSEIEKGKIIITHGSYENSRPAPVHNEFSESNLSMSIDYLNKLETPPGQNF